MAPIVRINEESSAKLLRFHREPICQQAGTCGSGEEADYYYEL